MSNRRKLKRLKGMRGLRARVSQIDEAQGPAFAALGLIEAVDTPDDEKTLIKTVPAKVDDVVVGIANLYDDGSVDVIMDKDAPPEAVALVKSTEKEFEAMFGYNIVAKEN